MSGGDVQEGLQICVSEKKKGVIINMTHGCRVIFAMIGMGREKL